MLKELKPKSNTGSILNTKLKAKQETINNLSSLNTLNIHIIRATLLVQLIKKPKYIIFAIIITNIKKALVLEKHTNPIIKVLIEYYKHLIIFL